MTLARRFLAFLFLLALALPAAAQKIYTLEVTAVSYGTAQVKISNVSPPTESNSTINSFKIRAPGTVSAASAVSQSATVTFSGNTVSVKNFNGIKAAPLTPSFITINVSIANCTQGTWYADVYTGNSWNGNKFSQVPQDGTTFAFDCLTLAYAAGANGSLSGALSQVVPRGGSGTPVSATPNATYRFAGWSDGSTANPRQDTNVQSNINVTANFARLPLITVSAGANGTITPGTGYVGFGSTNVYTITPAQNYRIASLTVDGQAQAEPFPSSWTFSNVTGDRSIGATFAANTLTVTPPSTVYVGTAFNVIVTFDGPPPPSVTLAWTCTGASSGSQTMSSPPALTSPLTFSVTLDKSGACTFKATAPGYFDGTFNTKVDVYSGTLGCTFPANKQGDLNPQSLVTYVKKSDQGKWGLIRGNNKDATACAVVPYTFEVDVFSTPQQAKFIVPNSPQKVAVKYTVVWGRFDVVGDASNIWAAKRPKLSWGIAAPVNGTNDFVPALPCVLDPDNPDLAGTYPNGFTSVPTADLDKLLPVIPNLPPFSDVYNATTAPNNIKGNPNYPQYQPGQKAKMCVAQQGWTATGSDATDPLDVSVDPATVQIWTSVIDQGDGYMNLD